MSFKKNEKNYYKIINSDYNKPTIVKYGDYICDCSDCGGRVTMVSGGYYSGIYIRCQSCNRDVFCKDWHSLTFERAERLFNNKSDINNEMKENDKFNYGMILGNIYNLYKQYGKENDIKDLSKYLIGELNK